MGVIGGLVASTLLAMALVSAAYLLHPLTARGRKERVNGMRQRMGRERKTVSFL